MIFLQVCCIAVTTIAVALPTRKPAPQLSEEIDSYQPQPYTNEESYSPFVLPTNLELPKAEASQVPFFAPDLTTALKAPQFSLPPNPNYYQVPMPSLDLVAPPARSWNPNNDPKFFYEVPATLTQQNIPTNLFPKKFNQELHSKSKPFSSKPKQEIILRPITEKEFVAKDKSLNKVFDSLAKKENQKVIQVDKAFAQPKIDFDAVQAEDDLSGKFGSISAPTHFAASHAPQSHGERHNFHVTGHDGPHSYKWGFDTGKG